ncbi:growth/differentiation factor 3-like [Lissotriton helveticus]
MSKRGKDGLNAITKKGVLGGTRSFGVLGGKQRLGVLGGTQEEEEFDGEIGHMSSLENEKEFDDCRARLLLDIRRKMLQAMGLEVEPNIPAGRAAAVRQLWSHHLMLLAGKQSSQNPNISSDEALLTRKLNCTEVSYQVTINDLGWDSWVIHPKLFFFTDCMGCPCGEGVNVTSTTEPEICRVDTSTFQHQEQQVNCCPVTTSLTPFAYLDPGRGLMLRSVEMNQECRCGP